MPVAITPEPTTPTRSTRRGVAAGTRAGTVASSTTVGESGASYV